MIGWTVKWSEIDHDEMKARYQRALADPRIAYAYGKDGPPAIYRTIKGKVVSIGFQPEIVSHAVTPRGNTSTVKVDRGWYLLLSLSDGSLVERKSSEVTVCFDGYGVET